MRSLDERVVLAPLYEDLDAEAEPLHVRRMAQKDVGAHPGVLGELLLARARGDELECAEETRCQRQRCKFCCQRYAAVGRKEKKGGTVLTRVAHGEQLLGVLAVALASGRLRAGELELQWGVAEGLDGAVAAGALCGRLGKVLRYVVR